MKKQGRRLAALALLLVCCFSWSAPAKADIVDGLKYNAATFWDLVTQGKLCWSLQDELAAYAEGTWAEKYIKYTDHMQQTYGVTNIDAQGLSKFYITGWTYEFDNVTSTESSSEYPFVTGTAGRTNTGAGQTMVYIDAVSAKFSVPVSGNYAFFVPYCQSTGSYRMEFYYKIDCFRQDGTKLDHVFSAYSYASPLITKDTFYSVNLSKDLVYSVTLHVTLTYLSAYSNIYLSAERPYLSGVRMFPSGFGGGGTRGGGAGRRDDLKYGIEGPDGTIEPAGDTPVVNEITNIFYNPVTNNEYNIVSWSYDYTDRSYTLDLGGGVTVKVTFGDDGITIEQGGDTYFIYYLVEAEPTPTPTPSPTPTPTPLPTPTASPNPAPSSSPIPLPSPSPNPDDPDNPGGILGLLKSIWDAILAIPKAIIDGLAEILKALFIPTEDVVEQFDEIVEEKLPVIGSLKDFGSDFSAALNDPAQSVSDLRMTTVVDLGKMESGIFGDAEINLLDVSWYLEYKPMVDDIIVGFGWLVFLWNLYGALPSIIHGGASGLYSTSEIKRISDEAVRKQGRGKG